MKNCLIIINIKSGSSAKIGFDSVKKVLGDDFCYTCCTLPRDTLDNVKSFDAIAICGGDGTLSSILEKVAHLPIDVYYFPVGTLNDKAKAERYAHTIATAHSQGKPIVIGKCDKIADVDGHKSIESEHTFSYVFAAGSFTPIGYTTKIENKKKFGILAYMSEVVKEYKPHKISAKIEYDDKVIEDDFTLIMCVKSPRCFGFKFNRAFNAQNTDGHLLAIRTPKGCKIVQYVKMFFTFFRTFFIGFSKEYESKNMLFKDVYSTMITLQDSVTFCKDGEKLELDKGEYKIKFVKSLCNFSVIDKF